MELKEVKEIIKVSGMSREEFATKILLISRDGLQKKLAGKRPFTKLELKIVENFYQENIKK